MKFIVFLVFVMTGIPMTASGHDHEPIRPVGFTGPLPVKAKHHLHNPLRYALKKQNKMKKIVQRPF